MIDPSASPEAYLTILLLVGCFIKIFFNKQSFLQLYLIVANASFAMFFYSIEFYFVSAAFVIGMVVAIYYFMILNFRKYT